MRRSTAIALVLLGGGTVTTAVALDSQRRCQDPSTGQPVACPSSHWSSFTHVWSSGSRSYSTGPATANSGGTFASVVRGGFGRVGATFAAGS